ncbi:exo-beta-N-acetylmuramidase NamZ family protein [Bogoriella caseilytica]|uniref:Uncharacterized protein YbbC (DUF1343 family) n=1 Tax=Bogoriella caseilytica TaxID=56055 RepID=A0A3N2BFP6_9MICO|nr:DUF1343 domain-containing protein [Bogoriella caseilytica]ROR73884.1 uncharacterized protein YbbC (DUF1343 family) [Bogoriella caseilytica]
MTSAATSSAPTTGLTRVLDQPTLLPQGTVALCANYTSVTADLGRGVDALLAAGVPLTSLLTPEHGYWGAAQAGESDGEGTDAATGLPVLDSYLLEGAELEALLLRSQAEQIVVDLQDIGTRFYTYMWTLYDVMCAAVRTGQRVVVLDRPNPLGRSGAGPGLDAECASFVGRVSIPLRHGLTLGELARWFAAEHVPAATGSSPELVVIEAEWDGSASQDTATWVMPSPNMPTLDCAALYPATGLIEGTTLSEGRGTTKPFELIGAPWTDQRLAAALREHELPGMTVREAVFRPTFAKWAGETVHGVQFHVRDAAAIDPAQTIHTVLSTVRDLYPDQELWRHRGPGIDGESRPPFADLLWGSSALRHGIDSGASVEQILAASPPAPRVPADVLHYPGHHGDGHG